MVDKYQELKNEYIEGGSKAMIAFTDIYVAENEYDDSFAGFLDYLYECEGRFGVTEHDRLTERTLSDNV